VKPFAYTLADSAATAVASGATYLAGGTNLIDLMKFDVVNPDALVDVTALPYDAVEEQPDGGVRIGALVRNSELAAHPVVRRRYPVLAEALLAGASGQLRNMATTAGNLLQRTRCAYFMDVTRPCNKRAPGSGCSARTGDHSNLAILGASEHCVATNPSDMAVAMMALDAVVRYETADGPGELPLDEFYRLPGDTPHLETNLPAGALITAVDIPPLGFGSTSTYRKARERASYAFAIGSVAAALQVEDGAVVDVRLALGAVAHKPWRARQAEERLRGQAATPENFGLAADTELAHAVTLPLNDYKLPLMRNMIVATLSELAA
jgi:xanthine dehydrogenase YagS FAD-binding subunit